MAGTSSGEFDNFDPYHKWLGIPKGVRPPTLYQLLAISPTETDVEVIATAFIRQQAFVTQFQGGPNHDAAARLLLELERARSILLDNSKRRKYDQKLRELRQRTRRYAEGTDVLSGSGSHSVGEDNSITRQFAGIIVILCVAFAGMAIFAFNVLPWSKQPDQNIPQATRVDEAARPVLPAKPPEAHSPPAKPNAVPEVAKIEEKPPLVASTVRESKDSPAKPAVATQAPVAPIKTVPQRQPPQILRGHRNTVHHIAVSADGALIASASEDRSIKLWKRDTGREIWSQTWGDVNYNDLAFEADGKRLWVANSTGIRKIDVQSGEATDVMNFKKAGEVTFGQNCALVATHTNGESQLFTTAQRKSLAKTKAGMSKMQFNSDVSLFAFGEFEGSGRIRVFRIRDKQEIGMYTGMRDRIMALRISPNDRYVAATSGCARREDQPPQYKVMVWESATGKVVLDRTFSEGWCYGLAFSPNSDLIAAGGIGRDADWGGSTWRDDNKIRVWKIDNGNEVLSLTGHTAAVQSLAFTPDGNALVSGSCDSTVRVWRMDTPNAPVDRNSPDRVVAESVLGSAGHVEILIHGQRRRIQQGSSLPDQGFQVARIDLSDNKKVIDDDLRRQPNLVALHELILARTSISDEAFQHLFKFKTLVELNVAGTVINGIGFRYIRGNESIETLLCGGCPVADGNLMHLKALKNLSVLGLIDTKVTDAGLDHVREISTLRELRLNGTQVTDRGLQKLIKLKKLTKLSVTRTKVTKAGADSFKSALPNCEVQMQ